MPSQLNGYKITWQLNVMCSLINQLAAVREFNISELLTPARICFIYIWQLVGKACSNFNINCHLIPFFVCVKHAWLKKKRKINKSYLCYWYNNHLLNYRDIPGLVPSSVTIGHLSINQVCHYRRLSSNCRYKVNLLLCHSQFL